LLERKRLVICDSEIKSVQIVLKTLNFRKIENYELLTIPGNTLTMMSESDAWKNYLIESFHRLDKLFKIREILIYNDLSSMIYRNFLNERQAKRNAKSNFFRDL